MSARTLRILVGWTVATGIAFPQAPPSRQSPVPAKVGEIVAPDNFIHSVGDLERSVAFYRDTLGLKIQLGTGGLPAPLPLSKAFSDLTDTRGAKFRRVTFELPS